MHRRNLAKNEGVPSQAEHRLHRLCRDWTANMLRVESVMVSEWKSGVQVETEKTGLLPTPDDEARS